MALLLEKGPAGDSSSVAAAATAADADPGQQENWETMYIELPPTPSLLDRLLFLPRLQLCYLRRLASAFTWRYILSVLSVYGISQGIGKAFYCVPHFPLCQPPTPHISVLYSPCSASFCRPPLSLWLPTD